MGILTLFIRFSFSPFLLIKSDRWKKKSFSTDLENGFIMQLHELLFTKTNLFSFSRDALWSGWNKAGSV